MNFADYIWLLPDLVVYSIAAPAVAFCLISLPWLLGWSMPEAVIVKLTKAICATTLAAGAGVVVLMTSRGWEPLTVSLGDWFTVDDYQFNLVLLIDRLSVPMLALSLLLVSVIAWFSFRYIHQDSGYIRFFALLHLFSFGSLVTFSTGSLDMLIGGWELVGITSVLLIAFFVERPDPVRNAMRVFATYRLSDLGLLLGVVAVHHFGGTSSLDVLFHGDWPTQDTALGAGPAALIGLLLLLGASGKSAQVPFSGWLPRAMEGPTPSSAIFYSAISVHMGVYLLLRAQPILEVSPVASAVTIIVGVLTAIHATLSGRTATDAKTKLAYASMAQVGLIFVEIGLGWSTLPLIHTLGHAALRTLQFLRAPSMLHDYHRVHAAVGGHLPKTDVRYETYLSGPTHLWLYKLALDRTHLETLVERMITAPALRFAFFLADIEGGSVTPELRKRQMDAHIGPVAQEMSGGADA